MAKNVKVIQATSPILSAQSQLSVKKRRVAAYARVSTEKDEQQNSYEAQIEYYTRYIKGNPEWIFAGIYSDEGITGTSIKRRDGFNKMIEDALAGKIDLIVTKSVSRFARNTVDSLTTVRKLKDKGVEVYFEKENIFTLDSKGELLITIMSSLAQEESRSISENTTWGQRKRFADGVMSLAYSNFLGYKKGANPGDMEIVEEEAVIVRRIYDEYLAGKSPGDIAKRLTADGIPTPAKKTKWSTSTVTSILHNEKYRGDAKLQKSFTTSFLDHRTQKNTGQLRVENPSPAMVAYREKYNHPQSTRPMICSDIKVPWELPGKAFAQAWNLIVSKKVRYQASLQRTAETDENPLTRYRAKEMIGLLDTVGRITEFDYALMLRTLDFVEVRPPDNLSFVFQCGTRITV